MISFISKKSFFTFNYQQVLFLSQFCVLKKMQDLSFVDFSYACLKNVFFSRANLQCAKFRVSIPEENCLY